MDHVRNLLTDPAVLAEGQGWSREVYTDLLQLQSGDLTEAEFRARYAYRKAVLEMDMTSCTSSAIPDDPLSPFYAAVARRVDDSEQERP